MKNFGSVRKGVLEHCEIIESEKMLKKLMMKTKDKEDCME